MKIIISPIIPQKQEKKPKNIALLENLLFIITINIILHRLQ
ncbi:hypothetical protein CCYN2B_290043 [Capnocytophaga cynodegmi]|uniref:Uncharacterized protein n=1 Tax=Capnocytophaga cynodegmi TaxID=28189 RepID=A0A0B7HBG0_9FLAO|nr:hypothetical protein CCYN2B_290043 [Capnocytophaga cynodegmi]